MNLPLPLLSTTGGMSMCHVPHLPLPRLPYTRPGPRRRFDVYCIHEAIKGPADGKDVLVEHLCHRPPDDLDKISAAHQKKLTACTPSESAMQNIGYLAFP